MTPLFSQIEKLVPTLDGWCSVPKAQTLAAAVIALRPSVSLEIGVWGGRSLLPIALAHREIGKGRVIAIDPWSRAASEEGQSGANRKWWGQEADHELVYRRFMKWCLDLNVAHLVNVHRAPSNNVSPPACIDLLSLDGNHGPQVHKDVERFCPCVRVGGLVFLDDLNWEGGFVAAASVQLKGMGFLELFKLDTGAVYQRIEKP